MRGVGRVLSRGISRSTFVSAVAVAAGVVVLCVVLALSIAGVVRSPETGVRPLPRASHLPLQPSQSSNAKKKAAREPVHSDPSRLDAARRAPQDEVLPETGRASWYQLPTKTASGEQMDGDALTAAHNTLPLGTRVRVANLDNGRAVVVRINDRGPFAKDRIIDLSKAAAERLGMIADGVARVAVTPVAGEAATARGAR